MLKEFKVKNFRSFSDWVSFNFDEIRDYGFNTKCIKNGLINKAVLYGANSSGKSNLGFAIMDISTHLFDGVSKLLPYKYFLSLDSTESEATFVYIFKFDDDIIEYTYKKDSNRKLTFEEIKENGKLSFQYNYVTKKIINELSDTASLKYENNSSNFSMVKFIYNNSDLSEKSAIKRIVDFAANMLWFRSVRNFEFITANVTIEDISDYIISNDLVGQLQSFFGKNKLNYDLSIEDNFGKKVIVAKYKNGMAPLAEVASTGTMSLWLYFYWMHKNNKISFLFIDEFDAFYHFDLAKEILSNIIENDSFQSILTTHNTYICNNELLRPDCYFMIQNNVIKNFPNRTQKALRQGHNLEKMMLSGEFDE